jgi:hypothetical protein
MEEAPPVTGVKMPWPKVRFPSSSIAEEFKVDFKKREAPK